MSLSQPQTDSSTDALSRMGAPWLVVTAGVLGAVGVCIGAYAAHGLESFLGQQQLAEAEIAKKLGQCEVAVRYQMLHTLALLAVGLKFSCRGPQVLPVTGWLGGVVLFCGGLYSMVFLDRMGHWSIVPLGGLCFIVGWLGLAITAFQQRKQPSSLIGS